MAEHSTTGERAGTYQPAGHRWDRFPVAVLAVCAAALIGAATWLVIDRPEPSAATSGTAVAPNAGQGGIEFGRGDADPTIDPARLIEDTAAAMGAVASVEFELTRSGASIYIDQFESIALDHLIGQFELPADAQAAIDVTIDGNTKTRIGAIAYDDEVWVSNPVTGNFETLPPGYDIDPSKFFDPSGGWEPLLTRLTDVRLIGVDERDGFDTYHLSGTASAADVSNITVGLIRDQDVEVELWIDPATSLVTHLEFDTEIGGDSSQWAVALRDYGADFSIAPPPDRT